MSHFFHQIIIVFLIFCTACNTKIKEDNLAINKMSYETGSHASVNFSVDSFDSKNYSSFPYWEATMEQFGESYIDTFSVAGIKFRIVHEQADSFPQIITLEKLTIDKKWLKRIEFYDYNKAFEVEHLQDINRDGYIDILRYMYFDEEIYFFDPRKMDFVDSVGAIINPSVHLIDKVKNIFCDFQSYRENCGQIHSTLYTFKGLSKYELYQVELYNCDDEDENSKVTKLILHKCIAGTSDSLVKVEETKLGKAINIDDSQYSDGGQSYFNHKAYWLKRYKKLLGL